MITKRNTANCYNFSSQLKCFFSLFILLSFISSFSQIHISENTVISFTENTVVYSSSGFNESTKKEILKNQKEEHDFSFSDSLIQIVRIENKKNSKEGKSTTKSHPDKKHLSSENSENNPKQEINLFSVIFRSAPKRPADSFSSNSYLKRALTPNQVYVKSKFIHLVKNYLPDTSFRFLERKKFSIVKSEECIHSEFFQKSHTTRPPPI